MSKKETIIAIVVTVPLFSIFLYLTMEPGATWEGLIYSEMLIPVVIICIIVVLIGRWKKERFSKK